MRHYSSMYQVYFTILLLLLLLLQYRTRTTRNAPHDFQGNDNKATGHKSQRTTKPRQQHVLVCPHVG